MKTVGVHVMILAVTLALCNPVHERVASSQEGNKQDTDLQYAFLVLPGGEGAIDYLLVEIGRQGTALKGKALYLSYFHDSLSYEQLSLKDAIQQLNKGDGACVHVKGSTRPNEWTLETDELILQEGASMWRYKWTMIAGIKKSLVEWKVHQDYWFGSGHFPEDYTVKSPLLSVLPLPLQERKDCAVADAKP